MTSALTTTANDLLAKCGGKEHLALYAVSLIKHKGDKTAAYRELHPKASDETCRVNGSKNYSELLNTNFSIILEARNLGWERVMGKLDKALDATKLITSPTEPDREMPDWGVQHKYLTTLIDLIRTNGAGQDAGVKVTGQDMTIEFVPK
jgi:hypothetical protein